MQTRLIHDVAWQAARAVMAVIENLLREEEKRDCFLEILARVKAGLEDYELRRARELARLAKPGAN